MSQRDWQSADNDDPASNGASWGLRHDPLPDARYHFEICQIRPKMILSIMGREEWIWRLLSPSGASVVECGGYPTENDCRAAVDLLRGKAASATLGVRSDLS